MPQSSQQPKQRQPNSIVSSISSSMTLRGRSRSSSSESRYSRSTLMSLAQVMEMASVKILIWFKGRPMIKLSLSLQIKEKGYVRLVSGSKMKQRSRRLRMIGTTKKRSKDIRRCMIGSDGRRISIRRRPRGMLRATMLGLKSLVD